MVIAVFAVLAAIILPNVLRLRENYRTTACLNNLEVLAKAADAYSHNHQGRYPVEASLLVPDYLPELPICQSHGDYLYMATENPDLCLISCQGAHRFPHEDKPQRPTWSSLRGLETEPPLRTTKN